MNTARLSFPLLLQVVLGSSVAEKKELWVEELPEDALFWGIRMLSEDASMSMLDCEIDVSFIAINHSSFCENCSHQDCCAGFGGMPV